jgi:prolyl-tRNA editing enzyme YbaK/EbsC (Cys-tRNA(Pro) deacylase)
LQDYDTVLPAAGSINSAVRITPQRLAELTSAQWIDVTQPPVMLEQAS